MSNSPCQNLKFATSKMENYLVFKLEKFTQRSNRSKIINEKKDGKYLWLVYLYQVITLFHLSASNYERTKYVFAFRYKTVTLGCILSL